MNPEARSRFLAALSPEDSDLLLSDWRFHARDAQLPPPGDWTLWSIIAGRGSGKTQAASAWLCESARDMPGARFAIVCRTAADVRDTAVEGPAGVIETARRFFTEDVPKWEPSKRKVTWPSGATALCFSSDEPDQLRGPQFHRVWGDEVASWAEYATFSNMLLGLRLGDRPRGVLTTTPKMGSKIMREILKDPSAVFSRMKTTENAANLSPAFLEAIARRYGGTTLGRQELDGEFMTEAPGALFKRSDIDGARVTVAPADLVRIVVAIDPAVTANENSDETGIVVAGKDRAGELFILEDCSGRMSPDAWARRAVDAFDRWKADRIVAETNQGGAMVELTIRSVRADAPYTGVTATRGKALRAEPVAALYEQGRVHHVSAFPDLEDQMCSWEPGDASPDRLDALVWACTELGAGSVFVCGPGGVDGPGMGGFDSRDGGLFTDFLGSDSR